MKRRLIALSGFTVSSLALLSALVHPAKAEFSKGPIHHVLIISVDGLHALDVENYVQRHPKSAFAGLAETGITYTGAHTVSPADSFPGLVGLMTGGTPAVTGVFYDVTYDRRLSPPGSACKTLGTTVTYTEDIDGKGAKYGAPVLDVNKLPLDPAHGCTPLFPHSYLRVNTVFEVIRQAGGHTAWIDKHPVYEILNGPSGKGVEDLYTPEIGEDMEGVKSHREVGITGSIHATERYDAMKVQALIHEIDGYRHDGKTPAAVPTIFGLNLQAVNVGEKLGGYRDATGTPTPALEDALRHSDELIGGVIKALRARKLLSSTLVILTAKHGNGPIDPAFVRHVDEHDIGRLIEQAAPGSVAHITTDQVALIWLKDQSKTQVAAEALMRARERLGIDRLLYGPALNLDFPPAAQNSRTPDIIVIPVNGVIYAKAGNTKKAEHGGFSDDDTHVALIVSNPYLEHRGEVMRAPVITTQVAPTAMASLGLAPNRLQAVAAQGTPLLPGQNWGDLGPAR